MSASGGAAARANARANLDLNLEVLARLGADADAEPYSAGTSLVEIGLRYATLLGTDPALPFFRGALRFLERFAESQACVDGLSPQQAWRCMNAHWALFGTKEILNQSEPVHLRIALAAVGQHFSEKALRDLRLRIRAGEEDVQTVSLLQMVFIAMTIVGRSFGVDHDPEQVAGCTGLPVSPSYRALRDALFLVFHGGGDHARLHSAYSALINVDGFHRGVVAGLTLSQCWPIATACRDGQPEAGAVLLLPPPP